MAKELHVELVAVEQQVWSGAAEMVVARTTEGELGVLPGHAPLLGQLAEPSLVRIKRAAGTDPPQEIAYQVSGGFLSVTGDIADTSVTVLAEDCEPADVPAD